MLQNRTGVHNSVFSVNFVSFAIRYKRLILFGFGLTFFSSFGQTFLISVFVPGFLESFGVSYAYFGSLYSAATLGSAFILAWAGALIDRVSLKKYAIAVTAGYAAALLTVSFSLWIWMLFLGLLGIRLFGQGLCGHTAHTTIARYFSTMRGKALSLSNLGFSLGEAVLPLTITALIALVGWRISWASIGLLTAIVLPVLIISTLGRDPLEHAEDEVRSKSGGSAPEPGGHWKRRLVLKDSRFYLLLPAALASPFLLTGFFLYQTQLAVNKGWEVEIMASSFIAFALSKSGSSLLSGSLIDRFTACRLYPFFLIPLLAGFSVLIAFTHPATVFVYMFLAGITMGAAFNITTSLYAELYGTANLGAIRSMMTMFMVISTAASPVLFGLVLDSGHSFEIIIKGALVFVAISTILAIFIYRHAGIKIS